MAGVDLTTEAVWRSYNDRLRSFIRARVPDESDADDVLQEVFLKVHDRLASLRNPSRLAPWLYRIARNAIVDQYRQRRPAAELPEDLAAPMDDAAGQARRQIAESLTTLSSCIPEGYRTAVLLHEVDGMKQEQIARRLGLSLSGAKSRVQRGREMLRQALLDCCHLEFDRRGHIIEYTPRDTCCSRCRSRGFAGTAACAETARGCDAPGIAKPRENGMAARDGVSDPPRGSLSVQGASVAGGTGASDVAWPLTRVTGTRTRVCRPTEPMSSTRS